MTGGELDGLAADLRGARQHVRAQASQAVRKSGLAVQNGARQRAPVDTGAHRANIHMTNPNDLTAVITAGQHYAGYLEHGTIYMAAQPSMYPALEAVEPSFVTAMQQVGADLL